MSFEFQMPFRKKEVEVVPDFEWPNLAEIAEQNAKEREPAQFGIADMFSSKSKKALNTAVTVGSIIGIQSGINQLSFRKDKAGLAEDVEAAIRRNSFIGLNEKEFAVKLANKCIFGDKKK